MTKEITEFDKQFLAERNRFAQLKKSFDEVFDSGGRSKSRLDELKSDFVKEFNSLAKFLLKSNKKVKVYERGKNSYSGNIFIGGKSGISDKDYGGEGIQEKMLVEFFSNLDKVDIALRGELSKHFYDRWISFVACFEGGVERILFSNSKVLSGELKRKYDDKILLRKSIGCGDDDEDDADDEENDGDVLVDEVSDYKLATLNEISIASEDNGVCVYFTINGEQVSLSEFDNEIDLFSIRDYLADVVVLENEFRASELKVLEQQKKQFDMFRQKAQPFLNLTEL